MQKINEQIKNLDMQDGNDRLNLQYKGKYNNYNKKLLTIIILKKFKKIFRKYNLFIKEFSR